MIRCPHCQHKEWTGALFCSECGAQLAPEESGRDGDSEAISGWVAGDWLQLVLQIVETGAVLPVDARQETTLGRVSDNQPSLPDVDLSPHGAYEAGVSRVHASVKIEGNCIWINDLSSANGTRVNGQRVEPGNPVQLKPGDVLTLGKLKILVQVR